MLAADFITANHAAFVKMTAIGMVKPEMMVYYDRYQWHNEHGRSTRLTAEHYGVPMRTITHGNQQMEKRIVTSNLK